MHPVFLIEVNEVPNCVLDAYARRSPFMADFLGSSRRYETIAADRIQLDPWIAWPSFHRGVNDQTHGLLHLGQSTEAADSRYPPVWRMLARQGIRVGVYGSLFSSGEQDLSPYAFFVPDVFSPHDRVSPPDLASFQSFNLKMTRASARNASSGIASGGAKAIAETALHRRLRFSTLWRMAAQLVSERVDRHRLSRRRNTQTELHADVFCSLVEEKHPQFATFYTNNVAAAMHRFWSAALTDNSINEGRLDEGWRETYASELFEALYSVERLLSRLVSGRYGQIEVVLASALGQEEIPAENHNSFVTIVDPEQFVTEVAGLCEAGEFEIMPAMVPDFAFRFRDRRAADSFYDRLDGFRIDGYAAVETQERMHSKLLVGATATLAHIEHVYDKGSHFKHAVTFCRSDERTVHVSLQIDDCAGENCAQIGNYTYSFADLGLGFVSHDEGVNCTAQHCAQGSLAVYGNGSSGDIPRISSLDFVPSLLEHFGVAVPDYLTGKPSVALH